METLLNMLKTALIQSPGLTSPERTEIRRLLSRIKLIDLGRESRERLRKYNEYQTLRGKPTVPNQHHIEVEKLAMPRGGQS